MNLRDLRYLVALADLRHFGRAAESCHVSQPTLSTQVKKLEEELGVSLVERAPRHVMLTAAGQDIAMRARRVLAEVEQMRETARRTADPEAGSVRLGLFPTLGPYLLPHVVPRIRKRFPRLELLLVEEKTEVVLHMLREGKLDAAVLAMPVNEEWAETEFLFEEPFMLAVPASGWPSGTCAWANWATSTCCCSRKATACATTRWKSAAWPAPAKRKVSGPPAWKRCDRWSLPAWASPCCRCWR